MYWVSIQYIVKKFPDGLFLVTPYVPRIVDGRLNCRYSGGIVYVLQIQSYNYYDTRDCY